MAKTTTAPARPKQDWTPVRDGPVYCSPSCGGREKFGCTWAAYNEARASAAALRRRLEKATGPGWTVRVHENLGWHYAVERGGASISRSIAGPSRGKKDDLYLCIIN